MDRQLLRPEEVAEILGIGRSRVYVLIREGVIPSVRIGKSVRVPARAFWKWMDGVSDQTQES